LGHFLIKPLNFGGKKLQLFGAKERKHTLLLLSCGKDVLEIPILWHQEGFNSETPGCFFFPGTYKLHWGLMWSSSTLMAKV